MLVRTWPKVNLSRIFDKLDASPCPSSVFLRVVVSVARQHLRFDWMLTRICKGSGSYETSFSWEIPTWERDEKENSQLTPLVP